MGCRHFMEAWWATSAMTLFERLNSWKISRTTIVQLLTLWLELWARWPPSIIFEQKAFLIENTFPGPQADEAELSQIYEDAVERLIDTTQNLGNPLAYEPWDLAGVEQKVPEVIRNTSPQTYKDAVEAAREHILSGDIFQVVLSQRYEIQGEAGPNCCL